MINSPSKYTSLERLEQIRKDNCIAASGKEFQEQELEEMILDKRILEAQRLYKELILQEFSEAEVQEINDKIEANEDIIVGNEFCTVMIEGNKLNTKTIVGVFKRQTSNPYKIEKASALPKRYSFKSEREAKVWAMHRYDSMTAFGVSMIEEKKKRLANQKSRRLELSAKIDVGTILVGSWGYEQTNVDFYKVIEKKGFKIRATKCFNKQVEATGWASSKVTCGELSDKTVSLTIGSYGIKLHESCSLSIWDGKDEYCSWGH